MMRAIFLDRDGVINVNRSDHVLDWEQFTFLPGALAALARLHGAGVPCFVVTNQACVGRGLMSADVLHEIHWRMCDEVRRAGGRIEAISYCPHRPEDQCDCRKPRPGMLLRLADEHGVELRGSYMVGDALTDLVAGASVGCRTFLVLSGRGQQEVQHDNALPLLRKSRVLADIGEAADTIIRAEQRWLAPAGGWRWPPIHLVPRNTAAEPGGSTTAQPHLTMEGYPHAI